VTGGADWGKPEDRPALDLSQATREYAEATFSKVPLQDVPGIVERLRKATAQANNQRAMIDTAVEILKVVFKVAAL